jgi:hypothetical protein
LLVRSAIAALIAWVIITAPISFMPPRTWFAFVLVPLVVLLWICYIGKLLIDTFFYDRYKS